MGYFIGHIGCNEFIALNCLKWNVKYFITFIFISKLCTYVCTCVFEEIMLRNYVISFAFQSNKSTIML